MFNMEQPSYKRKKVSGDDLQVVRCKLSPDSFNVVLGIIFMHFLYANFLCKVPNKVYLKIRCGGVSAYVQVYVRVYICISGNLYPRTTGQRIMKFAHIAYIMSYTNSQTDPADF